MSTLEGEPLPEIHPIHPEGIAQLLRNLKPHKAAGPDNLSSYFLMELVDEIAPSLCLISRPHLTRRCYQTSGNPLQLYLYARKLKKMIPIIIDQFHLPVSAQKYWNMSFT